VAAKVCAEYSVDIDGITYDDWFLPSKEELNCMYGNLECNFLGTFLLKPTGVPRIISMVRITDTLQ
ncbi:MAG: hypothetical protein WC162_11375, partial [Sphaerochaetaceae bacterium]